MSNKNKKFRKRIIFVGCVEIGLRCLEGLIESKANIIAIITLAEKYAKNTSGYVSFDKIAETNKIPLFKVKDINKEKNIELIKSLSPDLIVVIGWQRLLKKEILDIPKDYSVGMHSSLLPKYRGRSPVNWMIINGEKKGGISFFVLEPTIDTGKIINQKEFDICFEDTCKTVYEKAAEKGAEMLKEFIPLYEIGKIKTTPQDYKGIKPMPKRTPEDGIIDWNKTALQLHNWVRALTHPYPGAFSFLKGKKIFVWEARYINDVKQGKPGEIIDLNKEGFVVGTGKGRLLIKKIQFESEKELKANNSSELKVGDVFDETQDKK